LPGVLFSGDGEEIAPDKEFKVKVISVQGNENGPISQKKANRGPREVLPRKVCSDRDHNLSQKFHRPVLFSIMNYDCNIHLF
jgi:hypothetical protein